MQYYVSVQSCHLNSIWASFEISFASEKSNEIENSAYTAVGVLKNYHNFDIYK